MKDKEHTSDDHRAIDALIARFFAVFDNRSGQVPELAVLDELFVAGAMIYKRDVLAIESMDLMAFKKPRAALFASGALRDFHEWEIDHQTTVNVGLASRVSIYQKTGFLNDEPYRGHGVKHVQLVKTEMCWKIVSITWEDAI